MTPTFGKGLGLLCVILALCQPAKGQTVMDDDSEVLVLGAVQVGAASLGVMITTSGDSALLELAISGDDDPTQYVPLFASTYRGIPSVTLDVYVAKSKDAVWVVSSWPDNAVLAYHKMGTDTAITAFGEMALLDAPVPEVLSGGPVPFPPMDPESTQKLASFYYVAED
jgi:hypothetical protein